MFTTWERWTYGSIVGPLTDHLQAPLYNNQVDIDGKPGPCHGHGPIGRERWLWYPENGGTTRENQGTPSKFRGFILVHVYFILLSILMVKNSDIMWHLVDPQPCCGNLTLKGRAVLYWTLIIVLGTNQHEINMSSTWNQHETNMTSTWKIMTCNQHAKHQVAKGGIPSNPPLNQLVTSLTSPRFKHLPDIGIWAPHKPVCLRLLLHQISHNIMSASIYLGSATWSGTTGKMVQRCGEKLNCRYLGSFKMVDVFFRGHFFWDVWGWYVTIIYYNNL